MPDSLRRALAVKSVNTRWREEPMENEGREALGRVGKRTFGAGRGHRTEVLIGVNGAILAGYAEAHQFCIHFNIFTQSA